MSNSLKKERNSNYELMRIISMFLIVLYHVILHGHLLYNCTNPGVKLILRFIMFFTLMHVNSFVLLCGYFQSKSNFKQSNLWSIVNANWFYRVVIVITTLILGITSFNKVSFIKEILPLNMEEYWFIKCYLLLYCISPFINKALTAFDKKSFQRMLIVLFIINSLIPVFTGLKFFNNDGHTLYHFVFLYMVGAYLREYPLNESYLFKKFSNNSFKLVLVFIFFFALIINFISYYFFNSVMGYNPVIKEFGYYYFRTATMYINFYIIIQSIAYFEFFGKLSIKNSKIINKLASYTFGVYLIHDNNYVRSFIYKLLKVDNGAFGTYKIIIYIFVVAIIIYVACTIIEAIRQLIFKFIYNRKVSKRIRDKYYNFIRGVRFD